jgi:hypothetical protein
MGANRRFDRIQFQVAGKIIKTNPHFKGISAVDLKRIGKQQAAFLEKDLTLALETLADLLPGEADRIEAFEIANSIATADWDLEDTEAEMLKRISMILKRETAH